MTRNDEPSASEMFRDFRHPSKRLTRVRLAAIPEPDERTGVKFTPSGDGRDSCIGPSHACLIRLRCLFVDTECRCVDLLQLTCRDNVLPGSAWFDDSNSDLCMLTFQADEILVPGEDLIPFFPIFCAKRRAFQSTERHRAS